MGDRRERAFRWFESFDERKMVATIIDEEGDERTVPVVFKVCQTCEGKGSHVNPSVDGHGISREDFDEDPDFLEDYLSGVYDVPCVECKGRRVVPWPAEKANQLIVERKIEEDCHYWAEVMAERRMGA